MGYNDALGTVSIFRDITHELEVDRLKSVLEKSLQSKFEASRESPRRSARMQRTRQLA